MLRLHGWDYVPTAAKLFGGMLPKEGLSEDEIAATAAVTPKGKEQEKADVGTPKEKTDSKRDRESPENSPFKSPATKKKIVLDDTVVEGAEVQFSTYITSSLTILAFSHTHTLTNIC